MHPIASIAHVTTQLHPACQLVHEWPEANALHDAVDMYMVTVQLLLC